MAVEAEEADRPRLPDADPAPFAADRRRGGVDRQRAEVQAPRRLGRPGCREAPRLTPRSSGVRAGTTSRPERDRLTLMLGR